MTTKKPTRGQAFAAHIKAEYDPLADADALLVEIGRLMDRADVLEAEIGKLDSPVIQSSQGPRIHPLIPEFRSTFAALQRALASLGLEA